MAKFILIIGDEKYELDDTTVTLREASDCERLTGLPWLAFKAAFRRGEVEAMRFGWWLAAKRAGHEPERYSAIEFDLDKFIRDLEVVPEPGDDEDEDADGEQTREAGPTSPGAAETTPGSTTS